MKPSELRIGNWYYDRTTSHECDRQLTEELFRDEVLDRQCAYMSPIALNESWLERMPQIVANGEEWNLHLQNGEPTDVRMWKIKHFDGIMLGIKWKGDYLTLSAVPNVHSLQNKIFALIDEELEIKEEKS